MNQKIIIIIILVALAAVSLLVVATHNDLNNEVDEFSYSSSERYFIDIIQQQTLNRLDSYPVEGLQKNMYIEANPGLNEGDFINVETIGDGNDAGVQTSADATITNAGLVTLLDNVSERLDIEVVSNSDIDALLVLVSQGLDGVERLPGSPVSNTDTEDDNQQNDTASSCTSAGGNWLAEHGECAYISFEWCSKHAGDFNECASACRHQPEAEICTMQCVPVCQL